MPTNPSGPPVTPYPPEPQVPAAVPQEAPEGVQLPDNDEQEPEENA